MLEELVEHFKRFPGVGPRQARRFAMHLLTEPEEQNLQLARLIENLRSRISPCAECQRFVGSRDTRGVCRLCSDSSRNGSQLLIVAHDSDVSAIERANIYDGHYFVFGGLVALLESGDNKKVRGSALKARVERDAEEISEVILAFPANPDGDNTARFVASLLKDTLDAHEHLSITHLGRGLSTGSELEYADPDTITFALQNRK